jgi:feruloyl esterase
MSDIPRADGGVLYSGYGTGDLGLGAPAFGLFGTGQMRYIVRNDANWSPAGFDPAAALADISKVIDDQYQFSASTAGLLQFMRRGGRILVWHGADDGLLSHRDTVRTFTALQREAGEPLAESASRFYIAPGVNHCAGGDGADTIDALGAMVAWVEDKRAPDTLLASKLDRTTGATRFTRPLCRYPAYPRYRGKGDVNDAASFSCARDSGG